MTSRSTLPIPRGWFQLAWSDQLAPLGVEPVRAFGRDLARGGRRRQGDVADRHCPHMGASLGTAAASPTVSSSAPSTVGDGAAMAATPRSTAPSDERSSRAAHVSSIDRTGRCSRGSMPSHSTAWEPGRRRRDDGSTRDEIVRHVGAPGRRSRRAPSTTLICTPSTDDAAGARVERTFSEHRWSSGRRSPHGRRTIAASHLTSSHHGPVRVDISAARSTPRGGLDRSDDGASCVIRLTAGGVPRSRARRRGRSRVRRKRRGTLDRNHDLEKRSASRPRCRRWRPDLQVRRWASQFER